MSEISAWHALYMGWLIAMARRHGLSFEPVADVDGHLTGEIVWGTAPGFAVTLILPPPSAAWIEMVEEYLQ